MENTDQIKKVTLLGEIGPTFKGDERPMHGLTLYLGKLPMALKYGLFTAYVFQDLLNKGYILAISYGNLYAKS